MQNVAHGNGTEGPKLDNSQHNQVDLVDDQPLNADQNQVALVDDQPLDEDTSESEDESDSEVGLGRNRLFFPMKIAWRASDINELFSNSRLAERHLVGFVATLHSSIVFRFSPLSNRLFNNWHVITRVFITVI